MQKITQLDLFSGIGGFHLGFERAGYEVKSYFSEIDKHAVAVYKQQFKDAEYVGTVADVRGAELSRIDLITFGSPCQDFSLAGKRKGLSGDRSSLVLEAIRLINECRPSVFIWENVKGTFSSNAGADFWAIIQAFTNIGGYRLEWQLCNTSWILPQNRERVYLVGYSTTPKGDWRGVFPIRKGNEKSNELERQQGIANCLHTKYQNLGNGAYISERSLKKDIKVKSATSKEAVVEPTTCRGGLQKNAAHFEEKSPALTSAMGMGGGHTPIVDQPNYRIRRLTPIECERLQGFPDNHTEYGNYDGEVKKMSNTQRYKQCGNAVTVDIVALVAEAVKPLFK
jgi:DNA (cytosine-5)-methyltransferase 1